MNKIYLYAVSVATLCLSSCGSNNDRGNQNEISIPVRVQTLANGSIQKFSSTTGTLTPTSEAVINSTIEGIYTPQKNPTTGATYKIGDMVKKGDVLVRLEDQEYENNTSLKIKQLNFELAKNELKSLIKLEVKGGATLTDIKNAEVKVATSEIDYKNAQIGLEKMNIKSPISGVIVDMEHYTTGVKVDAGKPIAKVMDYSKMFLTIAFSESTMNFVKIGQEVYITHYSLPGDTVNATVNQLSPAIDTETRTYKGVVAVSNKSMKLRPGMFVKTDVVVGTSNETLVIPKSAVQNNNGRMRVFIVDGTTAKMRNVNTGLENKDMIEIKSGLKVGDKLVIDGHETLRDNSKVQIQK